MAIPCAFLEQALSCGCLGQLRLVEHFTYGKKENCNSPSPFRSFTTTATEATEGLESHFPDMENPKRPPQLIAQPPHPVNEESPWNQGLMVYLEEPSPSTPEHVEMVFMMPADIDTCALDERTETEKLDIVEAIRESTSDTPNDDSWVDDDLMPLLEGTFVGNGSIVPRQMLEYRRLVSDVVRYNCTVAATSRPQWVSSDPAGGYAWLEEEMRKRWAVRHTTEAGKKLRECKLNLLVLKNESPSEENEQEQRRCEKLIRSANKVVWAQYRNETLATLAEKHRLATEQPLQELEVLQKLYDSQRVELNGRCKSNADLFTAATNQRYGLAVTLEGSMSLVDTWVDVLDQLLDTTAASMRRVHTRVGRLMARDVRDDAARKAETEKRLAHPEALDFMFEAWSDIEATGSIARSMGRLAGEIEGELGRVALSAAEAMGADREADDGEQRGDTMWMQRWD
ncbi:uncharacterized protein K452DRAFT_307496 [Aplosporella prunicola CBS 121167]|uniref:Uncharacterized protein n=1 Tax=Aplosporella prunicola CBS 121167 TaxID=1176127 RepID=A0A6A6BGR8_9PEZI|nr:uncharacterized protein K452DRAFT_307496 [Aplosporella prunicola CBS 121167]KAF2143352.1 hypothetical protein K452DRAFT_307496 [Aplosporella prunicola CBS 121167]